MNYFYKSHYLIEDTNKIDNQRLLKVKKTVDFFKIYPRENNCQQFAASLELKLHSGYAKIINPCKTPLDIVFDIPVGRKYPYQNWALMPHGIIEKLSANPKKFIKDKLMSLSDNSRLFVNVKWKNGSGHVFNAWRCNANIYILDATSNYVEDINKTDYFNDIVPSESYIIVCNPKDYSADLINKTFSGNKDSRYLLMDESGLSIKKTWRSILEGLSCSGQKGKVFSVYEKYPNLIGKVRCNKIEKDYGNGWVVWEYDWVR